MIRKARPKDIDSIENIYEKIHEKEASKEFSTGWIKGVYPTRETAESALKRDDLFVFEEDGSIVASAIINQIQPEAYFDGNWFYGAKDDEIMVLHTLTVSPDAGKRGVGRKFVEFYEKYAAENGCTALRMDTNERNVIARSFYKKLGFGEAGIVPCNFNGIPGVKLVLLEKPVEKQKNAAT